LPYHDALMRIVPGGGTHVVAVAGSNPTQYLVVDRHGSAPSHGMTEREMRAVLGSGGMGEPEIARILAAARQNPR
jgi:hypothetical protein